jgi:hypothetical protein
MKAVTTKIRNESTKADYCKIHAEDGIPDDIYEEADSLLAIHDSAWKRL